MKSIFQRWPLRRQSAPASPNFTMQVGFDEDLQLPNTDGGYIARLNSNYNIVGYGATERKAIKDFLRKAKANNYPGEKRSYKIIALKKR